MAKKTKIEAAAETAKPEITIGYKGFDAHFRCRDMQYAVGQTFRHDGPVIACESGLHACEHPLDVFGYYPPATSRFALIEAHGAVSRHGGDTKFASAELTVRAELSLPDVIARAVQWVMDRAKPEGESATGDQGAASATGYQGAASATGYRGAASATGDQGAASATGYQGAASATGYQGAASATGDRGAASATGYRAVACALGWRAKARAGGTGAIVLVARNDQDEIVHIAAAKVGDRIGDVEIRPDIWYRLNLDGIAEVVEEDE